MHDHDSLLIQHPRALLADRLLHASVLPSALICGNFGHVNLSPVTSAAYHLKSNVVS